MKITDSKSRTNFSDIVWLFLLIPYLSFTIGMVIYSFKIGYYLYAPWARDTYLIMAIVALVLATWKKLTCGKLAVWCLSLLPYVVITLLLGIFFGSQSHQAINNSEPFDLAPLILQGANIVAIACGIIAVIVGVQQQKNQA